MWHAIFNTVLVGMGGLSIWIFQFHYSRFMAAHDAKTKADAEWRKSVDDDLIEIKRVCAIDGKAGEANGLDKYTLPPRGPRGRIREP